ncbi:MAG: hypothetical protein HYR70_08495 [Chloroflexi bacterium]|nr:hypothetical protein [Chloroflexota bacterium]MBI3339130.1 hypothetical protein [Chloroflexota bacterium]
MKRTLTLTLLGFFLLAACQSAATTTPLASTSTVAPSPKPTAIPSPSPVPTAAPTATLVPAPRTFEEQFDANPQYWSFLQIDNGQPFPGPGVEAGNLVFDLNAPNQWAYALYGGQDYLNVRVDAQVEVRAGDGAVGIVCRYSEKDGWYEFNIYSDQTYMLLFGQWLRPGVAHYMPMYRGESEKIKSGTNEIGLLCDGDTLTPFVNGVQMKKWQELKFGLKNGGIALSSASFNAVPFTIAYDWVKVSEP